MRATGTRMKAAQRSLDCMGYHEQLVILPRCQGLLHLSHLLTLLSQKQIDDFDEQIPIVRDLLLELLYIEGRHVCQRRALHTLVAGHGYHEARSPGDKRVPLVANTLGSAFANLSPMSGQAESV